LRHDSRAKRRPISFTELRDHDARICDNVETVTMATPKLSMAYDKAYFDKWYRSRQHRVRTPAQIRRIVSFTVGAAEYILDRPIRSVLDVGAGEGHWQPLLRAMRPTVRYVGVEPSAYAVGRYGARRGLRLGSVETLNELTLHESAPEGFDLVVCCGVLNYVATRVLGSALEQLMLHTSGVAWLELFTKHDDIEGDVAALKPRAAEWYRDQFRAAGYVPCGLHLYAPADRAAGLTALETCSWR
jgi:SAM-dependent methyltransferase